MGVMLFSFSDYFSIVMLLRAVDQRSVDSSGDIWPEGQSCLLYLALISDSNCLTRELQRSEACRSEPTNISHASLKTTSVVGSFSKEHPGTFLAAWKHFLYVCCFFGGDRSLLNTWSCLVLSNFTRFMPGGTAIPFSRFKCFQINPLLPLHVKDRHFLFLTRDFCCPWFHRIS